MDAVHRASFAVETQDSSPPLLPSQAVVGVEQTSVTVETHRPTSSLLPHGQAPAFAEVEVEIREQHDSARDRPELRQAHDGKWYTWDAFVQHYGRVKAQAMWKEANMQVDHTRSRSEKPEQRQARDGQCYTWAQFVDYYGRNKARIMWNEAGTLSSSHDYSRNKASRAGMRNEDETRSSSTNEGWLHDVAASIMELKPMAARALVAVGARAKMI